MRPKSAVQAIDYCFRAGKRPMLWSAPGVGKTSIIKQIAAKKKKDLVIVHGLLLDPADAHGFPVTVVEGERGYLPTMGHREYITPDKIHTIFSRPGFMPKGGSNGGILFLDEFTKMFATSQCAFSQLLLDGHIGEHYLPEGWDVAAASNRLGDRAGDHAMPTFLANRVVHLELEVHVDDWCEWAITEAIKGGGDIQTEVAAFIRSFPQHLHGTGEVAARTKKGASEGMPEQAFPTPRSWEFVSDILKQAPIPSDIEFDLVAGTIGKGSATEFRAFLNMYRDAPSTDRILSDPKGAPIPKKPDIRYAVALGLARVMDKGNVRAALTYLDRMESPDVAIMAVKVASERDESLCTTKEFTKFFIDHKDLMNLGA